MVWSNPDAWDFADEGYGGNKGNGNYGLPEAEDDILIPSGKLINHF